MSSLRNTGPTQVYPHKLKTSFAGMTEAQQFARDVCENAKKLLAEGNEYAAVLSTIKVIMENGHLNDEYHKAVIKELNECLPKIMVKIEKVLPTITEVFY